MSGNLLQRLQAIENGAQKEAWDRWMPKITAICRRMLHDEAWAEEVAADLWMDFVYDSVQRVRNENAMDGYLRMMTVRRCVRLRDRRKKHQDVEQHGELARDQSDPSELAIQAIDGPTEHARLQKCLGALRQQAQDILRMRFHLGMTQERIGVALGVSKQYAGRVLGKSLEVLRLCLEATP